jgi:hypothetical protein
MISRTVMHAVFCIFFSQVDGIPCELVSVRSCPNTDLFTFALHVAHACSAFSSGTLHERNQEGGDAVLVAGHLGSFEFGQAFAKALADRKRDIDNELLPMHSITHMKVALIKVRRQPSIG